MSFDADYRSTEQYFGITPEPLLTRHAARLDPERPVLDVGMGQGRNALWLAERGFCVDGIEPSVVAQESVREMEIELGTAGALAQLQQRPVPPGGQLLKPEYLSNRYELLPGRLQGFLDDSRAVPPGTMVRMYGDMTFKGKATSDYVVLQVWARHEHELWLLDQVRGQWGLMETVRRPARRSMVIQAVAEAAVRNPRKRPWMSGSAAVPPCPTTPVWIPNRPVKSAAREGRHGTSVA